MWLLNLLKRLFFRKRCYKLKVAKPLLAGSYGYLKFVFKRGCGLSNWTERKAIRKYNNLVSKFVRSNGRYPNRFEVGRIIINASHITIKYRRGNSGHWGRQKVRQYLFNLNKIPYKKR